jgi:hypothetical protein
MLCKANKKIYFVFHTNDVSISQQLYIYTVTATFLSFISFYLVDHYLSLIEVTQ